MNLFTQFMEESVLNQGEWKVIRELKKSGISVTAIAKQLNLDRKTVRKAIYSDKLWGRKIRQEFEFNSEDNNDIQITFIDPNHQN